MYHTLKSYRSTMLSLMILLIIFSFSLQAGSESDLQSGFVVKMVISLFEFFHLPTSGYPLAFYVRKVAHFTEYFVFGLSLVFSAKELKNPKLLYLGFLIPIIDEGIQAFVPNRVPSMIDMGIDALGLVCGILFIRLFFLKNNKVGHN